MATNAYLGSLSTEQTTSRDNNDSIIEAREASRGETNSAAGSAHFTSSQASHSIQASWQGTSIVFVIQRSKQLCRYTSYE